MDKNIKPELVKQVIDDITAQVVKKVVRNKKLKSKEEVIAVCSTLLEQTKLTIESGTLNKNIVLDKGVFIKSIINLFRDFISEDFILEDRELIALISSMMIIRYPVSEVPRLSKLNLQELNYLFEKAEQSLQKLIIKHRQLLIMNNKFFTDSDFSNTINKSNGNSDQEVTNRNNGSRNPYESNPYSSNPYSSNPYSSNPYDRNQYDRNPYSSNPYTANPYDNSYGSPNMGTMDTPNKNPGADHRGNPYSSTQNPTHKSRNDRSYEMDDNTIRESKSTRSEKSISSTNEHPDYSYRGSIGQSDYEDRQRMGIIDIEVDLLD